MVNVPLLVIVKASKVKAALAITPTPRTRERTIRLINRSLNCLDILF